MKYVIKRVETGRSYVRSLHKCTKYFVDTSVLEEAKKYDTIAAAIKDLQLRAGTNPNLVHDEFTIVGIKEINQPRYEEVAL